MLMVFGFGRAHDSQNQLVFNLGPTKLLQILEESPRSGLKLLVWKLSELQRNTTVLENTRAGQSLKLV